MELILMLRKMLNHQTFIETDYVPNSVLDPGHMSTNQFNSIQQIFFKNSCWHWARHRKQWWTRQTYFLPQGNIHSIKKHGFRQIIMCNEFGWKRTVRVLWYPVVWRFHLLENQGSFLDKKMHRMRPEEWRRGRDIAMEQSPSEWHSRKLKRS